ncbi:MAG: hypothetical protein ACNYZG_02200 [Gammaproteobacteria bacterium]
MSERYFLLVVGAFILTSLYLEIDLMIYILCLWLLFEAITDIRLTTLSQKLMRRTVPAGLTVFETQTRFDFDAFRTLRIVVSVLLAGAFILIDELHIDVLWFVPWFLGFAIMGAGVSGICPTILLIRWLGFR